MDYLANHNNSGEHHLQTHLDAANQSELRHQNMHCCDVTLGIKVYFCCYLFIYLLKRLKELCN